MKYGYVNYEHKTTSQWPLWQVGYGILQKSTVRHAGEDERSTRMIWMKWWVLPPTYLGVLGRASGFILEWSGNFFFRRGLLPCTSLCQPSRSIQRIAFNNPPWKLKIDTKTCDLEKAALYVYIYIYILYVYNMVGLCILIHVKLSGFFPSGICLAFNCCWGSTLCPKIGYGSDKKTPEGIGLVLLDEECVWLE